MRRTKHGKQMGWWGSPTVGLALLCSLCAIALPAGPVAAQALGPAAPLDDVPLAALGHPDATLRGHLVSADYYLPGPGEYLPADDNWLVLDYRPSALLAQDSTLEVRWNDLPISDTRVGEPLAPAQLRVRLPAERIDPDLNHLQIQAVLRLESDTCPDDDTPARALTILNTSSVHYSYVDREAHPRSVLADLGRYPAPFFRPNAPQPAPVRFIVPQHPSSAEVTALVRIAAQLGQFAGTRELPLDLAYDGQLSPAELAVSHLIFVGRVQSLPTLSQLPETEVRRAVDGSYLDDTGRPVPPGTGVILEAASPWNPARMALAVTGADDQAVERAAVAMSSRAGLQTLHGDHALIADAQPAAAPAAAGSAPTLLADLGRGEQTVAGVGDHTLSFSVDLPSLVGRGALPFDLVMSHSPLLDRARSSFRIALNGVPLTAASFQELAPARGTKHVELPAAALRPGSNTVDVTFSLRLPGEGARGNQGCQSEPGEQAWAVLHADSRFDPPIGGAPAAADVTLDVYPYPFVRQGSLDEALLVVPESLGDGAALVRFAADLGRQTRAAVMGLRAVTASTFTPAAAASASDVMLWGLPQENPLLGRLGSRLPIRVDERRRLVLSRDLLLAVRDNAALGVIQEIPSPWVAGRTVLVVTATDPAAMPLAVQALRQGPLAGNAALAARLSPQPLAPGASPTPSPLATGAASSAPVQVRTFRLTARRLMVDVAATRRRYVWIAALSIGAAAALVAGSLAYRALAAARHSGGYA